VSDGVPTPWGPLPEARILTGDEPIDAAGAKLQDFWAWSLSDLQINSLQK
jgi:hypothetical protein